MLFNLEPKVLFDSQNGVDHVLILVLNFKEEHWEVKLFGIFYGPKN